MLFTLRPLILESQGLIAALLSMAEKTKETFAQDVLIKVDESILKSIDMGKQGVIFYIVEEAVNNARKHAQAAHIWVSLRLLKEGLTLLKFRMMALGSMWRQSHVPMTSVAASASSTCGIVLSSSTACSMSNQHLGKGPGSRSIFR